MMLAALLASCTGSTYDGPVHTLAFGGDVTLGRGINRALHDPARRPQMLGELPWLREASVTVVNGEGVISLGGRFYDKGESRPYTYRAHPHAVDVLRDAGVDVVMVGNNHANDYGPFALAEELDRLRIAGLDYAGGGRDATDARRPAYVRVDDTVLAIVGADLTYTEPHQATAELPGILWLPGMDEERVAEVVEGLRPILAEARAHADLVLFSPHWGDNFVDEPTPHTRRLAREILALGFDAILGHSAHRLQGVEVVDGKPVIYDAGNLLTDYPPPPEDRRSAVFVLSFDRSGVREVEIHPVTLQDGRSRPAQKALLAETLAVTAERSEALGAEVERRERSLVIHCDPGPLVARPEGAEVPARPVPAQVQVAPSQVLIDEVPATARPAAVRFANGVELVGTELLVEDLRVPKAGNVLTLYFRADRPQADTLTIAMRARQPGRPPDVQDHLPGDWLLPGSQWPLDKVLKDQSLIRYLGEPKGEVEILVGLLEGGRPVPIERADQPTERDLVVLPGGTYREGARRLWDVWPRP